MEYRSLFLYLWFLGLSITSIDAQTYEESSLLSKPYDSLISLYDLHATDSSRAMIIARVYFKKARIDNDSTKMGRAYERMSYVSEYSVALSFLDSSIYLSRNSTHKNYPSAPYAIKAYYQYYGNEYEESLNNAILAYNTAKKKGNVSYQISGLDLISNINGLWQNYREALDAQFLKLKLLEQNPELLKIRKRAYLYTLSNIGTDYVRLKMPDSALHYFKKGINVALTHGDTAKYYNLVQQSGTALYLRQDYEAARDSLDKGYMNRVNNPDYSTYPYYLGSIHIELGEQEKGIAIFREIDSTYKNNEILYPELTSVYQALKNYSKKQGNLELQLRYLNDLIVVNSLINEKEKYVKEKTQNDFRIPALLEEKEQLLAKLELKNKQANNRLIWLSVLLTLSFLVLGFYIRQQQVYKRRFKKLLFSQDNAILKKMDLPKQDRGSISDDTWSQILSNLNNFEERKKYLFQKTTLQSLAKHFKTNGNYLSKVINVEKGMNFASYINDLRVVECAKKLKENQTFRKYTIKAISLESGFNSAESFAKAFYKKFGIYPSYYIKQLESSRYISSLESQ